MAIDITLAKQVGTLLKERNMTLVTAESCTAGGLSYEITRVAGSSDWFDRAYVTYSNQAKHEMLEIPLSLIEKEGAVSERVALQMTEKALRLSYATWSISITGVAGPNGGTPDKPVGTVWIAIANQFGLNEAKCHLFTGTRESIREDAIKTALETLLFYLRDFA